MLAQRAQQDDIGTSTLEERLDYPAVLFGKLAAILGELLGSQGRNRGLADLEDLLLPFADGVYREEAERLEKEYGLIHHHPDQDKQHQREWLRALMGLMKRREMLGKELVDA